MEISQIYYLSENITCITSHTQQFHLYEAKAKQTKSMQDKNSERLGVYRSQNGSYPWEYGIEKVPNFFILKVTVSCGCHSCLMKTLQNNFFFNLEIFFKIRNCIKTTKIC